MKESTTIEWLPLNKTLVLLSPKLQRCLRKRPERIKKKLQYGKNFENNSFTYNMIHAIVNT